MKNIDLKNSKGFVFDFPKKNHKSFRMEFCLFIPKDSLPDEPFAFDDPHVQEKIQAFYKDKKDVTLESLLEEALKKDTYLASYMGDLDEDFEEYIDEQIDALEEVGLFPMDYCTLARSPKMAEDGNFLDTNEQVIENVLFTEEFNELHTGELPQETISLLEYIEKNYILYVPDDVDESTEEEDVEETDENDL